MRFEAWATACETYWTVPCVGSLQVKKSQLLNYGERVISGISATEPISTHV